MIANGRLLLSVGETGGVDCRSIRQSQHFLCCQILVYLDVTGTFKFPLPHNSGF